jgi:SAM-dependent methyltransferase
LNERRRAEADEIDRTMRASFRRVEQAARYRSWVLDHVRPWLGQRVLEVGCGVGHITASLLDLDRVVAVDVEPAYLRELEARLGPHSNLRTLRAGAEEERLVEEVAGEALDSALVLNVLEHVDDDVAALSNLSRALEPGARIVLQVPAHEWLFGEADRALGHRRRYDAGRLRRVMLEAALDIERIWQFNALGVVGWLVSGKIRREPMFSERTLAVYEALIPVLRRLEPARGVPLGLSFMAVGRTSEARRAW